MASKTPEEKVDFLLKVLATCEDFKPNYGKLKDAMNINTNSNAQRQFKGIVEAGKQYTLESSRDVTKIVENSDGANTKANTAKPRKKRTKKDIDDSDEEPKAAKKARKSKAVESDDEDDE